MGQGKRNQALPKGMGDHRQADEDEPAPPRYRQ